MALMRESHTLPWTIPSCAKFKDAVSYLPDLNKNKEKELLLNISTKYESITKSSLTKMQKKDFKLTKVVQSSFPRKKKIHK